MTCVCFAQRIAFLYPGGIDFWCSTYTSEAALLLASRAHLFTNGLVDFDLLCDTSVNANAFSFVEIALGVSLVDAFVVTRATIFDRGRIEWVNEIGNGLEQMRRTRPCG